MRSTLLTALAFALAALASPSAADAPAQDGAPQTAQPDRTGRGPPSAVPAPQPVKRTTYAGLRLRQNPEGVVVIGVTRGPLDGDGFQSPSVWRGDLIESVNGQTLDAEGYRALLKGLAPGDTVRISYRRSAAPDAFAAIPKGDPEGELRSVEIVLDDAGSWTGPIGLGLPAGRAIAAPAQGELEDVLLSEANAVGLRAAPGGLEALLAHLASVQRTLLGPGTLPAVAQALERPLALDAVEAEVAQQVRALASPQPLADSLDAIHRWLRRTLDVPAMEPSPELRTRLGEARRRYHGYATGLLQDIRDETAPPSARLREQLGLLRAAPALLPAAVGLVPLAAQRAAALEQFAREAAAAPQPIPPELAERVRAAVDGAVLAAKLVDGDLWLVGNDGANRYDMSRIAAVLDSGGDDEYVFPAPAPGAYQIVIDQAGDDRYEAGADFAGPAAALFSVSLLVDRLGDDQYLSYHQGGIAAGLFGVAILIDEAGDDRYVNDTAGAGWSQGIGVFGAGLLIDRGGNDMYLGQKLAQGVGGPGGIGLVCDAAGNDDYLANGPHFPSSYGAPGAYAAMSQGFGYGLRGYAAGGIGALYDFAGDDRYTAGELGQGAGYFQGLGILHDAAGDDGYAGTRYVQGAAAHQAAGILVDDAGDDVYLADSSAAQGGAWDEGVAMLIERAGDDVYLAHKLAQGSAAHQSFALLVDLGGADRYLCEEPCLGTSADNAYHYGTTSVFSFAGVLDRGGKPDHFSPPRPDGLTLRTGVVMSGAPAASECCGVFSDE
jgi:hypothetical protein